MLFLSLSVRRLFVCKHLFWYPVRLLLLMDWPKPTLSEDNPKVYYNINTLQFEMSTDTHKTTNVSLQPHYLYLNYTDDLYRWVLRISTFEYKRSREQTETVSLVHLAAQLIVNFYIILTQRCEMLKKGNISLRDHVHEGALGGWNRFSSLSWD